jgi:uncharacterized protein YkwD
VNATSDVERRPPPFAQILLVAVVLAASVIGMPRAAVADPSDDASATVSMINDARWRYGLGGLVPDRELQVLANRQANRMADAGRIFHSGDLGYQLSSGWWAWAENVGYGPSVGWIHGAFMNSDYHASNLLGVSYNYVGVGVAYGADGNVYVAEVFGAW